MPRLRVASWSSSKVSGPSVGPVGTVRVVSIGQAMLDNKEPPGGAGGPMVRYLVGARALAVLRQELHHVVKTEATVAPLADAEERQLAAVAQALDGVDVQMKQVRYFTCRQHRP